jgi:hypothetical protein
MSTTTPAGLIDDLHSAGVQVRDVWDLVNAKVQYRTAVSVLVDWLRHLDDRVPSADRDKLREGLVRALTVPAARPAAAPLLIDEFRRADDPTGTGLGWTIGNALSVVADDSVFDDIASLVSDRSFGKARQMVVAGLARSKDQRAVPLLLELLSDDDVAAHALIALGKLKPKGVRPAVEALVDHPQALVRREARKALARLP